MTGPAHHQHEHAANFNRACGWGIALNVVFVGVEAIFGFYAHSLALVATGRRRND